MDIHRAHWYELCGTVVMSFMINWVELHPDRNLMMKSASANPIA